MEFFDSHAHLTSPDVLPHIDALLERATHAQVHHILNICTHPDQLQQASLLRTRYPHIRNAGAIHPHDTATAGESAFSAFAQAAQDRKLVAVGETGLDYHYEHSPRELQKQFLIRHLHLATAANLPVIFHCRDAFSDLFSIADVEYPPSCKAILHCFTGTLEEAQQVLSRGWFLSLSGIVTFKKSNWLRDVAKMVPLEQLLIETDTPYLAPQSHRGKPNEPAFVVETATCIAREKGISLEELAEATCRNGKQLFCGGTV